MAAERHPVDHSKSLPLERWLEGNFLSAQESAATFMRPENARAANAVDFIIGYAQAEPRQRKGAMRMMSNTVAQTPEMAAPLFTSLRVLSHNRPDLQQTCDDIRTNLLGGEFDSVEARVKDSGLIEASQNASKNNAPTAKKMTVLLDMMTCVSQNAPLPEYIEDPQLRGELAADLNLAAVSILRGTMLAVDSEKQFAAYMGTLIQAAERLKRTEADRVLCEIISYQTPILSRKDKQNIFKQTIGYSSDDQALQTSWFMGLIRYRVGKALNIPNPAVTRGEQIAEHNLQRETKELIEHHFTTMGTEKAQALMAHYQMLENNTATTYSEPLADQLLAYPTSAFNRVSPLWKYFRYIDRRYPDGDAPHPEIIFAPMDHAARIVATEAFDLFSTSERAAALLEHYFTVPGGEVRISDPLLVENALSYLAPDGPESMPVTNTVQEVGGVRISQLGSVEAAGKAVYSFPGELAPLFRENQPLEVLIWKGRYMLQTILDASGVLRGANGEELEIPDGQRALWTGSVADQLHAYRTKMKEQMRQNLRDGMETQELERLSPFLPALLTPELFGTSFEEIRRKLAKVKERVADPKRGLREDGLNIAILKGQLPEQTPVEAIHYNKSGSEATLTIGKTKIKIGMNLSEKPPRIETVNDHPFEGNDNEKIWLESIVFSPFADFISPPPKTLDDSVLLPDTEGLPLPERVKKTLEIIHTQIGHLYRLPIVNGKPYRFSDKQFKLVLALRDPLAGVKELNLKTYNETHPDPEGRIWDYAIYQAPSYTRNKPSFPKVTTPHAFDSLNLILEQDRQVRAETK